VNESSQFSLPFVLANRYRVTELIGAGHYAVVYAAHDRRLGRSCAIKFLRPDVMADDAQQRDRLRREAHALATLQHEAVVDVYDVQSDEHGAWIVMERIDGTSLEQAGPQEPETAASIVAAVAAAAHAAHEGGVLHRDIKPANILRSPDGSVHLADFGLAAIATAGPGGTLPGRPLGTPSFMSPEQAEGRIYQLTQATDVYSLGATLYCLLTGRPPFPLADDASVAATLMDVISATPVPPREWDAAIPVDLEAICLKCLARNPRERFATAADLQRALEQFLAGEPVPLSRRTSLKWLATAGFLGVGTAGGGALWWQRADAHAAAVRTSAGRPARKPDARQPESLSGTPSSAVFRTPLPDGEPGLVATLTGHTDFLNSLAFSPDGRTIASASGGDDDNSVRFWDVVTLQELYQCRKDDSLWVQDTEFSSDGEWLATARSFGRSPKVRLVDAASGELVRKFHGDASNEGVLSVDVSPDGNLIAGISVHLESRIVTLRVWKTADAGIVFEHRCGVDSGMMAAVRFLTDNQLLASTLEQEFGTRLFDIETQTEVRAYQDSRNHSRTILLSCDGAFFCIFRSKRIFIFQVADEHSTRSLSVGGWCSDIILTPDDRHVIAAGERQLTIWSLQNGQSVYELQSRTIRFSQLALSPDGRFLVSGGGGEWDSEANTFARDGDFSIYLWRLPAEVRPMDATDREQRT